VYSEQTSNFHLHGEFRAASLSSPASRLHGRQGKAVDTEITGVPTLQVAAVVDENNWNAGYRRRILPKKG